MAEYVEIAVNVPQVTGVFDYHLSPELEGRVKVGHLVEVPFGRREVYGVVLSFLDQPSVRKTKSVLDVVDLEAALTPHQIEFAKILAKNYLATMSSCIGLMLPVGLKSQADILYTAIGQISDDLTPPQTRLWKLLNKRGPLRGQQIDRSMKRVKWRLSAGALIRRGFMTSQSVLPPPKVRPKFIRTAQLGCSPEVARSNLPELGRAGTKALERRQAIMQFLIRETGPVDVSWVYAESGGNISDLRFLSERGLVILGESQVWRDPLSQYEFQPGEAPPLTKDQLDVWSILQEQIRMAVSGRKVQPLLLHGVTGSGKTEIYLHAVDEALALGKQAIILVPEIALTPQSVKRFAGRFPGRVGLLHSGLSDGERYDTWRRARSGDLSVLIGPRSALFTPFSNLGLIVVDESHDDSYYQTDPAPHYHARQAAIIYARLMNAVCLLGSATPDVVSIHRCRQGRWRYLSLPSRIIAHRQTVQAQVDRLGGIESRYRTLEAQAEVMELPPVSVVDMREELKSDNRSIFSRELQLVLGQTLKRDQQAILFLNRRGTATYIFCRDCGFTLKCPRCDIPLTYHAARGLLTCHYCGYQRRMPEICPQCKSRRIRHYGTGTQKVEAEVQALFPKARTLRWDYETTRKKGAHQVILSHFVAHRADILIGTQMLAKGLDLPFVTLVGVVLADVGLSLPDYRATERTFQVLTQVAGRAGRSPLGGQVILQTFQPENYVVQAAAHHDYKAFFKHELAYRQQLGYPPFTKLIRLEYTHTDFSQAEQAAKKLAAQIREWLRIDSRRATRMIGPVPCFFGRLGGMYRWQIIISGPDPVSLLRDRKMVDWKVEVDPPSLL